MPLTASYYIKSFRPFLQSSDFLIAATVYGGWSCGGMNQILLQSPGCWVGLCYEVKPRSLSLSLPFLLSKVLLVALCLCGGLIQIFMETSVLGVVMGLSL